ncbi:hypothetical protein FSARC_14404 [Fusarium sarcochroum]|uniref:Uncharacterized protein n=1 Tax=Fusarium sarcochroum TaxID=1208366 RepID=A0A8H4STX0_9HYPO|nr:hypothetical protein FSARC_14404 [Fusarium sarcochroum]
MPLRRSLNPDKPFLQDGCKKLIDEALQEYLTPTLSDRRQIDRAKKNRHTHPRTAASLRNPRPGTIPRAPTRIRGLPPLFPAKSAVFKATTPKTPRRLLDISDEPDNETQTSFESDYNKSFTRSFFSGSSSGAALGENSQDSASLLTTPAIDITLPDLDEGNSQPMGPSFIASEIGSSVPRMASTQGTLGLEQIQGYDNNLDPSTMSPTELSQHLQDVNRAVEKQALSSPNTSSGQDKYSVEATCEGGYRFSTTLQFDDKSKFNLISQALVSELICTSEGPIGLTPVPPGVLRMARMPDGTMAALGHLLYVRLRYESPTIPFPTTWVRFFVYHGTGGKDDKFMVLGNEYTTMLQNRATSSTANHTH